MIICGSKPQGVVRSEVDAVVVRILVVTPGLDKCSVGFEKTEMRRLADKHHNGAFAVGCDRRCFTVPCSAGRQLRPVCRIDVVPVEQARLGVSTRDESTGNQQDNDEIFHGKPHTGRPLEVRPFYFMRRLTSRHLIERAGPPFLCKALYGAPVTKFCNWVL